MKKYYSLETVENEAYLNIYGEITSFPFESLGEVSAVSLSKQLAEIGDVSKINVYINSYGGEVAEGLAIYNALKRHKAKVVTYCDGFAASIASVIFMAGDERVMNDSSLLMIHNAWSWAEGNADQLRKQAEDLEKITQASVTAYKTHSTLTEKQIKDLMDNETWILPEEALSYGFATSIEKTEKKVASQNAKMLLLDIIKQYRQEQTTEEEDEEVTEEIEDAKDPEETEETEETEDTEDTEETQDPEGDPEDEEPKENGEDEEKKVENKINSFFNAILKM